MLLSPPPDPTRSGASAAPPAEAALGFAEPGRSFAGHEVLETLYVGRRSLVVRCRHAGQPVIVKLLRHDHLGPGDVARFRREYELSRRVEHPGVVGATGLGSHDGVLFLTMADDGARCLREHLRHGPLPLSDALDVALGVVDALQALHLRGVLHKDIAPANIIADLPRGIVRLIDFGIAADMSVERALGVGLTEFEGTLATMAPEQSGRMLRDVDYRADFYALGATLQELLTGAPPFGSIADPVQAVHAHLALMPRPLHQGCPAAPLALVQLVARLLAKEPEDRYQSHHVLRRDLERIRDGLRDPVLFDGLVLAQGDLPERFQLAGRLYGRAEEARQLLEAFSAAAAGAGRVVTLAGASGIGKTALVQEVQRTLFAHRGHLASGKFNPFGQQVPCAAFVQALTQRVGQVLALPPGEQSLWATRLAALLGGNVAVAQAAVPGLGTLLGAAAPADTAPGPAESENRFVRTMQLCVAGLASAAAPLVLFIDDLQWADRVSRRLLRELALDEALRHVMVIGAYRAEEVGADHPLAQDLAALHAAPGGRTVALALGPLTVDDTAQWLADSLRQPPAAVQALAAACHDKTGGNPFFFARFVEDLVRRQHIWLDRATPRWRWSLEPIQHADVADNVARLMLEQLRRLPPETTAVLTTAACLGSRFELQRLARASDRPTGAVLRALVPALEAGLVVPRDARYQWLAVLDAVEGAQVRTEFSFAHDRVQEAAYRLADDAVRPALHLAIGRRLRDAAGPAGAATAAPDFGVVNLLNHGADLITDPGERLQLAQANAQVSALACDGASFDLAADYAAQAVALQGEAQWQTDPAAALALRVHAARMAALRGDRAAMDALIDAALPHADTPAARARLLDVRIESFYASGQLDDTLDLGLAVLRLLGAALPEAATPADAVRLVREVRAEIEAIGFEALAVRPAMDDALCLQQLAVAAKMTAAAYIARPALLPLLTVMQVRLMVARGHAPVALSAYSVMGLMVAEFLGDYPFGYRLGRMSMDLVAQHGWRTVQAHAGFSFYAFLRHWMDGIASGLQGLMAVQHNGVEMGNLRHAGLGLYVHGYHCFLSGMPLADLEPVLESHAVTLRRIRQPVALDYLTALRAAVRALRQQRLGPAVMEDDAFSAIGLQQTYAARADQTGALFLHAWQGMLHTLAGRPREALAAGEAAVALLPAGRGMVMVPFCLFFNAMAALQLQDDDAIATHCPGTQERLDRWAAHCADVRPLAALLHALVNDAAGHDDAADDAFATALAAAHAVDNLFLQGLTHWLRSQALAHHGLVRAQAAHAERAEARALFLRWGGSALAERIDHSPRPGEPLADAQLSTLVAGHKELDLFTLMKLVQAITAEVALDALLARMLNVLRESAGAGRAAIVLQGGSTAWLLQADSAAAGAVRVPEGLPLEAAGTRLPLEVLRTVLNTAAPVLIDDVLHAPAWQRMAYFSARCVRSVLCLPLVRLGGVVGALYLENEALAGAFSRERIQFLELLSGNVVNAIDNARLYSELRSLADTLEERVVERTRALADSEARILTVLNNAPLPVTVTRLVDNTFVFVNDRAAILAGMSAAELLGRTPRSMYRDPADRERAYDIYRREGAVRDYEACLVVSGGEERWMLISMVPIVYDGAACSLATLVDITQRKHMEDALRRAATTDGLTGAANRRHFIERAGAELERARRYERPLAMAMFDVDYFKQINDRHGHAAGDEVLRAVTRACLAQVRQHDIVGRLGGEEFAVLMPDTPLADAMALAGRLRADVEALEVPVPGGTARVTASFGVSALEPGDTLDALLARADRGMYDAKHGGRNRIGSV